MFEDLAGVQGTKEGEVVTTRSEILGLFILSLLRRLPQPFRITIFAHGEDRRWPHNECTRAVDATGTFAFLGEEKKKKKGRPADQGAE